MNTEPLTQDEVNRANEYIATLGPDKMEEKISLLNNFKLGPDVFNPIIRRLINQ
jgi:hypothetical protein